MTHKEILSARYKPRDAYASLFFPGYSTVSLILFARTGIQNTYTSTISKPQRKKRRE